MSRGFQPKPHTFANSCRSFVNYPSGRKRLLREAFPRTRTTLVRRWVPAKKGCSAGGSGHPDWWMRWQSKPHNYLHSIDALIASRVAVCLDIRASCERARLVLNFSTRQMQYNPHFVQRRRLSRSSLWQVSPGWKTSRTYAGLSKVPIFARDFKTSSLLGGKYHFIMRLVKRQSSLGRFSFHKARCLVTMTATPLTSQLRDSGLGKIKSQDVVLQAASFPHARRATFETTAILPFKPQRVGNIRCG
ncbi:hypothetical protein QBC38DRAFT_144613 [Podospora fimiseda]|uniref:Uncharacterized protein n=1 Tax=Podospora fimiseda TaxID=252190 RepID=A0AAN7BYU2_9PEZI|nr:hypothetical protein QBC38DRAFT_144613 [Podospora fimiseda]